MKHLITLLFTINLLNASYLFDKSDPVCIEQYVHHGVSIYYQSSIDMLWYVTQEDYVADRILSNFTYNSSDNACYPDGLNSLGMKSQDYSFLMALSGLLFGFIFFFLLSNFILSL